jgi:CheY-like chemotaxis protein
MKPIKQSDLLKALSTALVELKPRSRPQARMAPGESPRGPKSLRILLAEDNLFNRKLAVALLEKRRHRVVVVGDGREALSALEEQPFDLVLMDVQMPEMDGFQATAAIRERERASGGHVPIVAMTAHAMKGDRERCLAAGMDGYVSKPIQPAKLFEAIHALFPATGDVERAEPGSTTELDSTAAYRDSGDRPVNVADELLARLGGNRKRLAQLVDVFLEECPKLMARIRDAIDRGDAAGLQRAAHTLRGAVGALSEQGAFQAAGQLETIGTGGDLTDADAAFAILQRELARLTPTLVSFSDRRI